MLLFNYNFPSLNDIFCCPGQSFINHGWFQQDLVVDEGRGSGDWRGPQPLRQQQKPHQQDSFALDRCYFQIFSSKKLNKQLKEKERERDWAKKKRCI